MRERENERERERERERESIIRRRLCGGALLLEILNNLFQLERGDV